MVKIFGLVLACLCFVQIQAIPPKILEMIPPEILELIMALRNECAGKNGVTDADIDSYVITNTETRFKCYMKCMLLESKWMSPDGTINYDYILDGSHSDIKPILEKVFENCRDIADSPEECGKAYNLHVCLQKADPERYFLP